MKFGLRVEEILLQFIETEYDQLIKILVLMVL